MMRWEGGNIGEHDRKEEDRKKQERTAFKRVGQDGEGTKRTRKVRIQLHEKGQDKRQWDRGEEDGK